MEFIARLKQLEEAYKRQYITPTEYHWLLNYFVGRLASDEASQ